MRFRGQKTIIVVVDEETRAVAGDYGHIKNCPIATAIKQKFGSVRVVMGGSFAYIKGIRYDVVGGNGRPEFVEVCIKKNVDLCVVLERRS